MHKFQRPLLPLAKPHFLAMVIVTMKFFSSLLLAWMLVSIHADAQTSDPEPTNNSPIEDSAEYHRFWQAELGGGHYMIALDRITSVSRHEYLLNNNILVDEVTVDSVGQAIARFYFIRPLTETMRGNHAGATATRIVGRAQEVAEHAAVIADTNAHEMVVKNYPDTTHARTIEYRILSAQQLTALYHSLRTAWETGKGRRFRAR
jgi:hypothetical protein